MVSMKLDLRQTGNPESYLHGSSSSVVRVIKPQIIEDYIVTLKTAKFYQNQISFTTIFYKSKTCAITLYYECI